MAAVGRQHPVESKQVKVIDLFEKGKIEKDKRQENWQSLKETEGDSEDELFFFCCAKYAPIVRIFVSVLTSVCAFLFCHFFSGKCGEQKDVAPPRKQKQKHMN